MTSPRPFHLGDILTVTTGKFVALRGVEALYDLLGFMTGESPFTHQIPRVSEECAPRLLEQHPELADVRTPPEWEQTDVTREDVEVWLAQQVARFGETLPVTPMPPEEHTNIDPITEMRAMAPHLEITVIESGEST